jgi:hypothetical protein
VVVFLLVLIFFVHVTYYASLRLLSTRLFLPLFFLSFFFLHFLSFTFFFAFTFIYLCYKKHSLPVKRVSNMGVVGPGGGGGGGGERAKEEEFPR